MGHLSPVAYIQMGNCWQECKNKFVLAFLCILVEMRVFDKVSLGRLTCVNIKKKGRKTSILVTIYYLEYQ